MRTKRKRKTLMQICPLLICLAVAGVGFLIYSLVTAKEDSAPAAATVTTTEAVQTTESLLSTEQPQTTETTQPETTEPETLEFQTVTEDYFDDALFIGDSRTQGLQLYSTLDNATFYAATSMSIFGIMDSTETVDGVTGIRNLLQSKQFGKIYIMFGINEAGYDTDAFVERYGQVVEEIRGYQPDAIIYVQGIMYVTAAKAAAEPVFSNDNIRKKNEGLKDLANGEDIFYLEVNDNLNDGQGNLPEEYTGDGVHLKASYYSLWRDYLLEHAIVTPQMAGQTGAQSGGSGEGASTETSTADDAG
ncbi:MAG: GDSL-type esterase/lipase family protein [Firmicutes bacterium]|nr:GDSL-type esterase/lipase family protein [Bacillota bacterium]